MTSTLLTSSLCSSLNNNVCAALTPRHLASDSVLFYITVDTPSIDHPEPSHENVISDQSNDCEHIRVNHQQVTPTQSTQTTAINDGVPTTTITIDDQDDFTRLGLSITTRLREIDPDTTPVVCFHSLTALLQLADRQVVFRFVHTLNGIITRLGGQIHYHFAPQSHAPEVFQTFRPLFETIINEDDRIGVQSDTTGSQNNSTDRQADSMTPSQPSESHTDPTKPSGSLTVSESATGASIDSTTKASDSAEVDNLTQRAPPSVSADGGTDVSSPSVSDTQPAGPQEPQNSSTDTPPSVDQPDKVKRADRVLPELDHAPDSTRSTSTNPTQTRTEADQPTEVTSTTKKGRSNRSDSDDNSFSPTYPTETQTNHDRTEESTTGKHNGLSNWEWPIDD